MSDERILPGSRNRQEHHRLGNITGLVGLASGLTMSSVAPVRSVCCRVLSPMCSFSPSNTRWSVSLALATSKKSDPPYVVSEPWYFANTENGAVGSRHSAFACHDQVWKPQEGSPKLKSVRPLAYITVPSIRTFGLTK